MFPLDDFGWYINVPAVSRTYFDLLAVWIAAEMLGEYNEADRLCSAESSATENSARWSVAADTLEAVFAELDERRQEQSSSPPRPADSSFTTPLSDGSTRERPLHALAPSQLVGTYTDLTGPFGDVTVSLNGDNATHPLLLAWETAQMALSPWGGDNSFAYNGHALAPAGFAILYTLLPGVANFDVDARGTVRGMHFAMATPNPYLTAAYAANLSSSSSSTGGDAGGESGGAVMSARTVELVVVLCVVSVVLLLLTAYALYITKRYRELSAAGGAGGGVGAVASSDSLRESLLSN